MEGIVANTLRGEAWRSCQAVSVLHYREPKEMELWSKKRLVVTVNGPEGGQQVSVRGPFARVGSHPGSDVVLPGVAKRTLYLHATDAGVYCLDLRDHADANSEQSGRWVNNTTGIAVEGYSLSVSVEPPADDCPSAPSLLARILDSGPAKAFRITCKGGPKAKYKIHRALTVVGRDTRCGLNLSGTKVSSPHCVLYCEQGRLWCVDLLSNNGIYLNGQRCESEEVRPGDRLNVGEFRLTYCGPAEATSAPPAEAVDCLLSQVDGSGALPNVDLQLDNGSDPSTVQLSKGDTVNVDPSVPAAHLKPIKRNKSRKVTAVMTQSAGHDSSQPAAPIEGQVQCVDDSKPVASQSADEGGVKLDSPAELLGEIRALVERLEEQDKQLIEIRGTLEAEQERWRLERDCLRYELTTQTHVIGDLKRELENARAILNRRLAQLHEAGPASTAGAGSLENAFSTSDELTLVTIGSQPAASVHVSRRSGAVPDRQVLQPTAAVDVEHSRGRSCELPDLTKNAEGKLDQQAAAGPGGERGDYADSQAAERETIQNFESMYSTVIWRQLQDAVAVQSQRDKSPLDVHGRDTAAANGRGVANCGEFDAGTCSPSSELSAVGSISPTVGSPPIDQPNELSHFVNERLHELDCKRSYCARAAGAGVGAVVIAACALAAWWLGMF